MENTTEKNEKLIKILKLNAATNEWNEREVTEEQAEQLLKDYPNSFKLIEEKKKSNSKQ